jgi:hypothetical protein
MYWKKRRDHTRKRGYEYRTAWGDSSCCVARRFGEWGGWGFHISTWDGRESYRVRKGGNYPTAKEAMEAVEYLEL